MTFYTRIPIEYLLSVPSGDCEYMNIIKHKTWNVVTYECYKGFMMNGGNYENKKDLVETIKKQQLMFTLRFHRFSDHHTVHGFRYGVHGLVPYCIGMIHKRSTSGNETLVYDFISGLEYNGDLNFFYVKETQSHGSKVEVAIHKHKRQVCYISKSNRENYGYLRPLMKPKSKSHLILCEGVGSGHRTQILQEMLVCVKLRHKSVIHSVYNPNEYTKLHVFLISCLNDICSSVAHK